ncbi:MAG: hypothetical protein H0U48_01555 [Euzebyaceae bacterium]|jgi:hypothetical protein|nr:hypothetical protein [Euzebyaceae bacterium]MBA3622694.1 hypothetical protein [Euzebyales bacterium]MDQ3342564.1 hypothetical protein [Actinomycetota bacterium]
MAGMRSTFPLRFRQEGLRDLVRDVAAREQISQNELIEQAVEHEVVARGAMLVADLVQAAERLRSATEAQYAKLVDRSITDFASGEQRRDPLQASKIEPDPHPGHADVPGAVAAFRGDDA